MNLTVRLTQALESDDPQQELQAVYADLYGERYGAWSGNAEGERDERGHYRSLSDIRVPVIVPIVIGGEDYVDFSMEPNRDGQGWELWDGGTRLLEWGPSADIAAYLAAHLPDLE